MSEHKVKRLRADPVRHGQVTRDLIAAIASGRYAVGSTLPTELELCELYKASRHTMRVAIGQLVDLGLVSRRKKAGTRVEAKTPQLTYRQSLSSLDDLVQFGTSYRRSIQDVGEVVMDARQAKALGCPKGSRWIRISSLRLNGQKDVGPVGWTDVYVDPSHAGVVDMARANPDSLLSTLIEQRYGRQVAEITQNVDAVPLPGRLARRLKADADTAAMRIVRHYFDQAGEVFEISETIHPAGRFTASSRLVRDGAK